MMMPSTITASTPAVTRIMVTVSIVHSSTFRIHTIFRTNSSSSPASRGCYFNEGSNWRIRVMIAGLKITTIKAGKMKNTSGGTIFTVVFALNSSARCRRFVRNSSECTRSDCPILVPKRSVWMRQRRRLP